MSLSIPDGVLAQIYTSLERAYPEEGAGFLLGRDGEARRVISIHTLVNTREEGARHNRYLITPKDYLQGEMQAETLGLEVIGVFHSHPDSPNRPSEYDREWAQPYFSYLITRVQKGKAEESRSWRLAEDRSEFIEESVDIIKNQGDV